MLSVGQGCTVNVDSTVFEFLVHEGSADRGVDGGDQLGAKLWVRGKEFAPDAQVGSSVAGRGRETKTLQDWSVCRELEVKFYLVSSRLRPKLRSGFRSRVDVKRKNCFATWARDLIIPIRFSMGDETDRRAVSAVRAGLSINFHCSHLAARVNFIRG